MKNTKISARLKELREKIEHDDSTGFSLIELVVVVLIIGIIAAIAIPYFFGAQDDAHRTVAQEDLRQLSNAMQVYEMNSGNYPIRMHELGAVLDDSDLAELGRATGEIDNKRFVYCTTADGSDMWIVAVGAVGSGILSREEGVSYRHVSTGNRGLAEYVNTDADGQTDLCTSVSGGEYDYSWWSDHRVLQEQIGREVS